MYVRLAFSVAAHLNSEILIVDEVLAVGDVDFQKKCLNKMGNIKSKDGRTVIFVSHNMNAISALCNKTVLLEKGELVNYGDTEFVVNQYLNKPLQNEPIKSRKDRTGNGEIQLLEINFFDIQLQNYISSPISGNNYIIELKIKLNTEILDFSKVEIALGINDVYGNRISLISNKVSGEAIQILEKNSIHIITISVHKLSLSNGTYSINSFISNNGIINDWLKEAISFTIEKDQFFNQNEYSFNNGMGNFHLNYTYLNNA
jgi:lipopolysaccharide transport system ATP-binding protein